MFLANQLAIFGAQNRMSLQISKIRIFSKRNPIVILTLGFNSVANTPKLRSLRDIVEIWRPVGPLSFCQIFKKLKKKFKI